MKRKPLINVLFALFTIVIFASCASKTDVIYYQNIDQVLASSQEENSYSTHLQPDDLLMIIVSAEDMEAALPFNLTNTMLTNPNNPAGTGSASQQLYLIDSQGNIEFPILGTIKLAGLTRSNAIAYLKAQISQYINSPIINLRIMNYKVTLQGEVNKPGVYNINSERITLPEAIALSGDMTIYGKRNNILIIREINGVKTPVNIDMTQADFIMSPYYYLQQNDIVYVQPNKTRINSTVVGPNITVGISALSLIVTIIALSTK